MYNSKRNIIYDSRHDYFSANYYSRIDLYVRLRNHLPLWREWNNEVWDSKFSKLVSREKTSVIQNLNRYWPNPTFMASCMKKSWYRAEHNMKR